MEKVSLLTENGTDLVEHVDKLLKNQNFLIIVVLASCAFYFVSAIITFPIYLYIYGQNRVKDKETAIYPIVDHFHWIAKNTFLSFVMISSLVAAFLFLAIVFQDYRENVDGVTVVFLNLLILLKLFLLAVISWISLLSFYSLFIFHEIQFILHFLLALQRFLLYFYPATEKYVNLTEKSVKRVIKLLYAIFLIIPLKFIYSMIKAIISDSLILGDIMIKFMSTQVVCNMVWNVLLIISIILYLLIMNSVRKLTNLTSAAQNKPHKYIFYQAILLLITRIPTWACCVFCYTQFTIPEGTFVIVWLVIFFIDFAQTPFTIQVTYLFCNRRNVNGIFTSVRELLCSKRETATRVNPVSGVYTTRVQAVE